MPWLTRGLRHGVVTTPYPRGDDGYGATFHGEVDVRPGELNAEQLERAMSVCPTSAIGSRNGTATLDRGSCILCGRCVAALPEAFAFSANVETSTTARSTLVVPVTDEATAEREALRRELAARVTALRRSIHVRHVDAGSDGSDEWEVAALVNPIYDVQRLGVFFTASPRHADVLLVTGLGATGMSRPVRRTWEAMPFPKVVVAAGVEAIGGGLVGAGYASNGGVSEFVPVDVFVPGSPATPFALLHGLLLAVGALDRARHPLDSRGTR